MMNSEASVNRMRLLPFVTAIAIASVTVAVTGCKESDPVGMGNVDVAHTPTMLTRDVETLISDYR